MGRSVLLRMMLVIMFVAMPGDSLAQMKSIRFTPSNDVILNPERGMFLIRETGMVIGEITPYDKLDLADLRTIRRESSLLFRYFGLKEWRTVPLPQSALNFISEDFDAIRAAGLKVIVRFCHAAEIGEPDAPRSIILQHMEQLKPILHKHKDVIAVVQAGFIGPWGEWHSSTEGHETPEGRRIVLDKLFEILPSDRFVQLRTPRYKQEYLRLPFDSTAAVPLSVAHTGVPIARIGHHNDCFLSDESDMGTYWRDDRLDTTLGKPYIQRDTRFVPMGGETCRLSPFVNCPNAIREMSRAHWSFLNAGYHPKALQALEHEGCLETIRKKLGYRIELVDAAFSAATGLGGALQVRFRFTNTGWAAPFNRRPVELALRNSRTHEVYSVALPADPRFWHPGDTVTIATTVGVPPGMDPGQYHVMLHLPDPAASLRARSEYALRLANVGIWEEATGFNTLRDSVLVRHAGGDRYNGTLWLRSASAARGTVIPADEFALMQNFPNPFNALTMIPFTLRRAGVVTIEVFDMLGRSVARLVDEFLHPSDTEYAVAFDASLLASGVYVTRMSAQDLAGVSLYASSRKLVLIR